MATTTFLIGIDLERMKGGRAERAVRVVILGACSLLMTVSPFVRLWLLDRSIGLRILRFANRLDTITFQAFPRRRQRWMIQ
jgi:hypothetical protein